MKLLLDTHTLIWWLTDDPSLSSQAETAIRDPSTDVFVSAASAWEIATKHRLGRLPEAGIFAADIEGHCARESFGSLPITLSHGQTAGALPGIHGDPFDRMLIAQALIEDLVLVSNERAFDAYGVKRLW